MTNQAEKPLADPPCVQHTRKVIDAIYDEIRELRLQFSLLWMIVNEVKNYLPEGTHRSMLEGALNETKLLYQRTTGTEET